MFRFLLIIGLILFVAFTGFHGLFALGIWAAKMIMWVWGIGGFLGGFILAWFLFRVCKI